MILKLKYPANCLSLLALAGVLRTVSIAANAPIPAATEEDISVYFSPKGGCADAIRHHIQGAQHEIRVQAYYFTSAQIAKELLHAKKRGVDITVLLDRKSSKTRYSSATFFNNQGIKTFVDGKHAIAHDKIILIDDRVIITGSFNFTKAAEESNVENLLVIKDKPRLFAAYKKHFDEHLRHAVPYSQAPVANDSRRNTLGNTNKVSDRNAIGTNVFVTKTGTKYHRAKCRYLRKSKTPIALAKARQNGYEPCSACKPDRSPTGDAPSP